MAEFEPNYPLIILLTGVIVFLTMLIKSGFERTAVPSLVGFLLLGLAIRLIDGEVNFLNPECREIFGFLGKLGLISLLFRVGLESDLKGLLKQLRRASLVWGSNILFSGTIGFLTAYYVLSFSWVTSIVVATAFTATSVGVSVAVWEEADALKSPDGELLVDVAELDDISAVVLMAILFAILPELKEGGRQDIFQIVIKTGGFFLIQLLGFGALCFLFSHYIEPVLTGFFQNLKQPPDFMLVVVSVGFIIAAVAALLDFSVAIGAFFGGLVFSRDPDAVKAEANFLPIYELFSPFFFIGLGLSMDPASMKPAVALGAVLLIAAVAGKLVANVFPVWKMTGIYSGVLIGMSMVPRAEITMVVMERGLKAGPWAVPPTVFGAMVMVSAATCVLSPPVVGTMLKRQQKKKQEQSQIKS